MNVEVAPLSSNPYTRSLLAPDVWSGLTITFSFPDNPLDYADYGPGDEIVAGFVSFSEMQKNAVRHILATISSFTNLVFTEVTGSLDATATLRFGNTNVTDAAFAFLPSTDSVGGDSWYSSEAYMQSPAIGNFAYFALLHEIGHALGLLHPHEGEFGDPMPLDRDWMPYTVMSYRSTQGGELGYYNNGSDFAQSYMMEDIVALQQAYGPNYSTNSGATVYSFSPTSGELFINGAGQGAPEKNIVFQTIWDGGGIDTYDFSTYTQPGDIDLRPGNWIRFYPIQSAQLGGGSTPPGLVANAHMFAGDPRSLIENAIGGSGDDDIYGNHIANRLEGGIGRDNLFGYEGEDHLLGGADGDMLYGGIGNDLLEGGDGGDNLHGEEGDDTLYGGREDDTLHGGSGNDILHGEGGGDVLFGGSGDDSLFGGNGQGMLHGEDGHDLIDGGIDDDTLYGGAGNDRLIGRGGNDLLDGGAGADTMIGGTGNDTYVWDDIGDVIIELADGGIDTLASAVYNLTAGDNIENVRVSGLLHLNVTGDDGDNGLGGNGGNNILDGRGGADSMSGDYGADIYYVDHIGDKVYEGVGMGTDRVYASVSFTMSQGYWTGGGNPYLGASLPRFIPGAEIEFLYLQGTGDLDGTGNEHNNRIFGTSGANVLTGMGGNDILNGRTGWDTAVFSGVLADYTITEQVDGSFLVVGPDGTDQLIGIEQALFSDQQVYLVPSTRQDGTPGIDNLTGTSGVDLLYGLAGDDVLQGLSGNDTLDGGTGSDTMVGGMGNDTFSIDSIGDVVTELENEGFDRIISSIDFSANPSRYGNIEAFGLAGLATQLRGNQLANELVANATLGSLLNALGGNDLLLGGAGNDLLNGGSGDDEMRGGGGDDSYFVYEAGDVIVELAGEGIDYVRSGVNYTLGANLEDLRLAGTLATVGTGNALANRIYGGSAGATLSGLDGDDTIYGSNTADTIYGGSGADRLVGNFGEDAIHGGEGNDIINGGTNIDTLHGDGGDDLILGGIGNDVIYGGTGNDTLLGEANMDTLHGEDGADILDGGDGVDRLIGGADRDVMTGGLRADVFAFADGDFAGLAANTADRITDFTVAQGDRIDLSAVDAILGGTDDAFDYIGSDAFSGTAGELRWAHVGANTMVYMDVDGDALADYAIRLDGTVNLAEASFLL